MRRLPFLLFFVLLGTVLTACNLEGVSPEVSFDEEQALQMAFDTPEIEAAKEYIEASGEQLLVEEATFTTTDKARGDDGVVHRNSTLIMHSSNMTYELGVVFDSEQQIFESYLIELMPLDSGDFRSTYVDILIGEISTVTLNAEGIAIEEESVREFTGFVATTDASLSLATQAVNGKVLNTEARLANVAAKYKLPMPEGHCTPHPLYCPPHDHPEDPDDGSNNDCDRESRKVSEKRREYNEAKANRDSKDRAAGEDHIDLLYWQEEVKIARRNYNVRLAVYLVSCTINNPVIRCETLKDNLDEAKEALQRAEDRAEDADEAYERSRDALDEAEAKLARAKDELDEAKEDLENCKD